MSLVLVADHGPVRVVTINRADKLNALDEPTRRELIGALEDAGERSSVRAIVLTGAGRAFCTGQDVAAAEELIDAEATVRDTYNPIARLLREIPTPVIAAINGPAVGAGMGIALGCDLRYIAQGAFMASSFSRVGLVPDTGTTAVLVRRLGHAWAFELATSARKLDAQEALSARLVNAVTAPDELMDTAIAAATTLAEGPVQAFALTKELMVRAANDDEFALLDREARYQGVAARTSEHRDAVAAFHARARTR